MSLFKQRFVTEIDRRRVAERARKTVESVDDQQETDAFVNIVLMVHCDCQYCNKHYVQE